MNINHIKKLTIGFIGIVAIPFFGTLFVGCTIAAMASIIAGIVRTFGYAWIPMVWMNNNIAIAYSIPYAMLAALICSALGLIGYKGLRYYLKAFNSQKLGQEN